MSARWRIAAAVIASSTLTVLSAALKAQIRESQVIDAFSTEGQITVNGQTRQYKVEHLPASSFPALPAAVAAELNRRGCLIPQTYEAHGPENVIRGSFRRAGENDWAALCSVHGTVSLLVFFEGAADSPAVLATAAETARLQLNNASGNMEFDWGIDVATPELVHEAQTEMRRRPARLDHDSVADSVIDGATVYHFYAGNAWTTVETRD
ncbi:MAG: hypothetical protein ACLQHF_07205 [Terracidiphilus sp.]